jgi:hypothetical protein
VVLAEALLARKCGKNRSRNLIAGIFQGLKEEKDDKRLSRERIFQFSLSCSLYLVLSPAWKTAENPTASCLGMA